MNGQRPAGIKNMHAVMILSGMILLILFAGCVLPSPQSQNNPMAGSCQDKACFIAAANDCRDMNVTITEDIGTFAYTSSQDCTFTKTLVRLNNSEMQEMKTLLEGKNMMCIYTKGKFDQRLVSTLIGGMENCDGDLKDDLGNLTIFS